MHLICLATIPTSNRSKDSSTVKNRGQLGLESESPECEHEPDGNNQGFYVRFVKMFPQSNAGNRNKEDECECKIDPFGILGKDLAWLDILQRKKH